MCDTGGYSISELSDLFKVGRPTIYRTLARQPAAAVTPAKDKPDATG